jgi:murein L,D-transpeptidase YafK
MLLFAVSIVSCLSNCPANTIAENLKVDKLVVLKAKRCLVLISDGHIIKIYNIALGRCPRGPKIKDGDGRTPEGTYKIDYRISDSRFHRALHISYPSPLDVKRANALGVPPGGGIMIHGIRNGFGGIGKFHRLYDWTEGCIAVTNEEIEEIWHAVPDGTIVKIMP